MHSITLSDCEDAFPITGLNQTRTRAEVNGTNSCFLTYNLYLGVKVTQNVAQYLLHNMIYAPVKFEVAMSKGEEAFTNVAQYPLHHVAYSPARFEVAM